MQFLLVLTLFLVPAFAHAEGTVVPAASTGTLTLREQVAVLRINLGSRPAMKAEQLFRLHEASVDIRDITAGMERKNKLTTECSEALRRSNRDTRPGVLLQCVRSRYLLELGVLRRDNERLRSNAFLAPAVRTSAQESRSALESAIVAIIDGIDSNVYEGRDTDLLAVEEKLRVQYRVPHFLAQLQLTADRMLAWIDVLSRRMDLVLKKYPEDVMTDATKGAWSQALTCFDENRTMLQATTASTVESIADLPMSLQEARLKLQACSKTLREATQLLRTPVPSGA